MSQQGGRPTGPDDDWWGQLYDDATADTGPTAAADSLDDRFASAVGTVNATPGRRPPHEQPDPDPWSPWDPHDTVPPPATPAEDRRDAGPGDGGRHGGVPRDAAPGGAVPPLDVPAQRRAESGSEPGSAPGSEPGSGPEPRSGPGAGTFPAGPLPPGFTERPAPRADAPRPDRPAAPEAPQQPTGATAWTTGTARAPEPELPPPVPLPEAPTPPFGPADTPAPPPAPPADAPAPPSGLAEVPPAPPTAPPVPPAGAPAPPPGPAEAQPAPPAPPAESPTPPPGPADTPPAPPTAPPAPAFPPAPTTPPAPPPPPTAPTDADPATPATPATPPHPPAPAPGLAPGAIPAARTAPDSLPPPALPIVPPPGRDHVGVRPPTYEAEPAALPPADPDDLADLVPDTVLDGARYGACTLRAASLRGDSARYRGEPRRDALLTARFGAGEQALVLVAMATGARATPGAHRAAAELCRWIGRAVGRSHVRLVEDIRAARRGELKSGLHRLTDRSLGRLRAEAAELGLDPREYAADLRCLLLPADPECRTRVFFGVGAGGLFRLRGGQWRDIEPAAGEVTGEPVVGFGSPPAGRPAGDPLTVDLGATAPPGPPRAPFCFRASVARPGDTLLMCTAGLADPLHGEPELSAHLAARWAAPEPPGLAAYLADVQVRVKGYADDRTAAAVWEA
ncbi:protein phosphatase 2C domain-containing protein [Streptomyces longwoodensis]|uniref:protein phosphatase 2C domain-containing protein n=1 Tax=Streptomyces longwoodensis TaxID=68231 RepID=UPI00224E0088|nr:protein phosphatase 2C domain-containing protein [Streptomyces longwoodensis]MCX4996651.1 protein phosphatase 2C domain-containing protein [Streptomyces longwoodensis]